MKFNFDEIVNRRGSNSIKWDIAKDDEVLPLWTADMDFRSHPAIVDAIIKRAKHGVFGYTKVPEAFYDAVVNWFQRRHNFSIQSDHILFTKGIIPAISTAIQALTNNDDKIIIQTPGYDSFFTSISNNGCIVSTNELIYKNGFYKIDFDDLEKKAADPKAKLMLLCSPHNPIGRVWKREELQKIGEICMRNDVFVISDEIHCDIVYQGHTHIPFASISDEFMQNSVTLTSPSKTFNLSGIQVAYIITANKDVRQKIEKTLKTYRLHYINTFAIEALITAYNEGEDWLEELKEYLYENYNTLLNFFKQYLPHLKVLPLEATYLVWIDCSVLKQTSKVIAKTLFDKEKLWIFKGDVFGAAGEGFIRINIATQREILMRALDRIRNLYGVDHV